MNFKNFIGNDEVKKQITYLLESNRLPHAIIIEGDIGLGKKTLAREIAMYLVCKNEDKPCFSCSACKKAMSGGHPDIFEYSGGLTARSFHIDVIRNVKQNAYILPNEAERKVYILGNAQSMSSQAQNALLKILEEPPEYSVLILTATSKTALLETVLSRCVSFKVDTVSVNDAVNYVSEKFPEQDASKIQEAASAWNGNIGKMIDGLVEGTLSKYTEIAREICKGVLSDNEYILLKATSFFEKDKQTIKTVCTLLKSIFRDAIIASSGVDHFISAEKNLALDFSSAFTKDKLLNLMSVVDNIDEMVDKNANNTLLITKFCYSLREAVGR